MDLVELSGALGVISDVCPNPQLYWFPSKWSNLNKLLKHEIIGCLYPAGNKTIQPQLEPFSSKVDAFVPHLTEQKLTPIHNTDPIQLTQPTALERFILICYSQAVAMHLCI